MCVELYIVCALYCTLYVPCIVHYMCVETVLLRIRTRDLEPRVCVELYIARALYCTLCHGRQVDQRKK